MNRILLQLVLLSFITSAFSQTLGSSEEITLREHEVEKYFYRPELNQIFLYTTISSDDKWKPRAYFTTYDLERREFSNQISLGKLGDYIVINSKHHGKFIRTADVALSPNNRFLVIDHEEAISIYDVIDRRLVSHEKKLKRKGYKSGNFAYSDGVEFVNDTDYYMWGSSAKASKELSGNFMVKRSLPSNEIIESILFTYGGVLGSGGPISARIPYKQVFYHDSKLYFIAEQHSEFAWFDLESREWSGLKKPYEGKFDEKRETEILWKKDFIWKIDRVFADRYIMLPPYAFDLQTSNFYEIEKYNGVLLEETDELIELNAETGFIESRPLTKSIQDILDRQKSIKAKQARLDSLLNLANTFNPKFRLNTPNWVYLGDQGEEGLASGIGDAISKDGKWHIEDGLFLDGEFLYGKMMNVESGAYYFGEFRNMKLNGYGRYFTSTKSIIDGTFVDGKLEGRGEMIDPHGTRYVGSFANGKYHGKGKITHPDGESYDGEFQNGLPHGNGVYINGSQVEACQYYEGKRIDQLYLIRQENEKRERERKLAELKEQQRQQYLAEQSKKKSSNRLLGAALLGGGFAAWGSSIGMDATQALELGTAMFQDVQSGSTSNLNSLSNKWEADFQAKRVQYETYSNEYAVKLYSPVENPNASKEETPAKQSDQGFYSKEWQERQQRIADMKARVAQREAEQRKKQMEDCQIRDPECKSCHCAALLNCNKGSNCQPD